MVIIIDADTGETTSDNTQAIAPGTQNTFSVSKSIPSVPLFVVKTTPRKQLDEMARTTQVDDTVERKALLEAFEETTMSNITLESESPQQAARSFC